MFSEEGPCDIRGEEPLTILGKGRWLPYRIIHGKTHKPAKEEIVVELFDEKPLTANRLEDLQQESAEQLLGRDRWPTGMRVQLLKEWRQFL